jgi:hypothetical protein
MEWITGITGGIIIANVENVNNGLFRQQLCPPDEVFVLNVRQIIYGVCKRIMNYVNIRRNVLLQAELLVVAGIATLFSSTGILEREVHPRGFPHGLPETLHLFLVAVVVAIFVTGHRGGSYPAHEECLLFVSNEGSGHRID